MKKVRAESGAPADGEVTNNENLEALWERIKTLKSCGVDLLNRLFMCFTCSGLMKMHLHSSCPLLKDCFTLRIGWIRGVSRSVELHRTRPSPSCFHGTRTSILCSC